MNMIYKYNFILYNKNKKNYINKNFIQITLILLLIFAKNLFIIRYNIFIILNNMHIIFNDNYY